MLLLFALVTSLLRFITRYTFIVNSIGKANSSTQALFFEKNFLMRLKSWPLKRSSSNIVTYIGANVKLFVRFILGPEYSLKWKLLWLRRLCARCVLSSDVPDPQFQVRPDPDPDFFFQLGSGRNRTRIFFSNKDPAGSGYQTKMAISGRIRNRFLNTLTCLLCK